MITYICSFVAQALVYLYKTKRGRNSFSWLGHPWNSLALGCTCLPTPGGICKCTYIFDAGFCSLLWHNMQKPLYVCLRWQQKKQTCKKQSKKPSIVAVNAKVQVQLTTSKLSWTHKFPQSEMFLQEVKTQTELWICQFSPVYLYIILLGFCAKWHWFGNIVAT